MMLVAKDSQKFVTLYWFAFGHSKNMQMWVDKIKVLIGYNSLLTKILNSQSFTNVYNRENTLAVLSSDPDTTKEPSDEISKSKTMSSCPLKSLTCFPLLTSQTASVLSTLQLYKIGSFGLNNAFVTPS